MGSCACSSFLRSGDYHGNKAFLHDVCVLGKKVAELCVHGVQFQRILLLPDYNLQQGSAVLPDICRSVCSNFVFSGGVSSWKGKSFSGAVSACDNCGCVYRRCVSVLEKGPCALRERRFVSCVCGTAGNGNSVTF